MTIPITSEAAVGEHPPQARGAVNLNPAGLSLLALLAEDFETHDQSFLEPGFWAIAVHRYGNWRMAIRPKPLRAPFSLLYRFLFVAVDWCFGIHCPYTVKLGRRVRIWYHGGIVIGANSVVVKDVPPNSTVFGVPARPVKLV